ncbi:mediator of RNA polymerase II transcription subunit 1.1 [Anopheles bellator]|uniref:mediator of RNA polymerase II transcription subunit 1.1 n=1 Tax=Anopheles bellator TaxID=139047 RepID=UPI002647E10E|nr:mediator of RNA polymerase II transcription subunit 1.1 [Anopheles bellator]XP_058063776.1 mediator of RNA polymerase II transcription subunit 1.1 [Anopheles bellator]
MLSYGMPVEDIAPARKEDIVRNRALDLGASSNSTTTIRSAIKPSSIQQSPAPPAVAAAAAAPPQQHRYQAVGGGRTGSSRLAKEPQGESSTEPLLLLLPPPPKDSTSAKVRVVATHRGRLVASDVVNGNGAGDGTAMSKLAGLLKHSTSAPGRGCIKSSTTAAGRSSSSSSSSSSHTGNVYYNGYRAVNEDDDDEEEEEEVKEEQEHGEEEDDDDKKGEEEEEKKKDKKQDKEKEQKDQQKQKEKEKEKEKEKKKEKAKEKEKEKKQKPQLLLRNSCNQQQQQPASVDSHLTSINPRSGANPRPTLPLPTAGKFVLPAPPVMKPLNGNGTTMDLSVTTRATTTDDGGGDGSGDVPFGSDSNSPMDAAAADCGASGRPKVNKLGKLPSKSVPLKRVSFGSSKGSMVETLVFETPTPLPEHAEREFFQSPAVLLGSGHTTVHSGGGATVQQGFPAAPGGTSTPTPNQHPHLYPYHQQQHHPQQQHHHHHAHHYYPLDGAGPTVGLGGRPLDDSGIELQEEVERSKVRVSFFQSSKPQSISPPELLHLYGGGGGGQNLIYFGDGGGGDGGSSECYVNNNNSTLDTYITSAALNQQYDSLPGHQTQQPPHLHPDHWDPNMAAFYGTGTVPPPSAYNRQMSTESGWDNPFRPGGDLSREADEIVNLIKGGKPITPTGDQSLVNGDGVVDGEGTDPTDSHNDGGTTIVDGVVTKDESVQLQSSQQNGTKSPHKTRGASGGGSAVGSPATKNGAPTADGGAMAQTPISNQVIPGPQSASHVVIDEKKKKKCTCCVIQ